MTEMEKIGLNIKIAEAIQDVLARQDELDAARKRLELAKARFSELSLAAALAAREGGEQDA